MARGLNKLYEGKIEDWEKMIDTNIKGLLYVTRQILPGMVLTEFSSVRFSGYEEKTRKVYEGVTPLSPEDVAAAVLFCATRPAHVNINEIILTTTAQASSTQIYRKSKDS